MAKATELNKAALRPAPVPVSAATSRQSGDKKTKTPNDTPIQLKWPAADAVAVKHAAIDLNVTISELILQATREFLAKSKGKAAAK